MFDVLVVGGGFAGTWAAVSAARRAKESGVDLSVVLVDRGDDLVIRPRLYEADPAAMRVGLDRVLRPAGVTRIRATVESVDPSRSTVCARTPDGDPLPLRYRRLVLAAGSVARPPSVPGSEFLHSVQTMAGAVAFREHLASVRSLPADAPGRSTVVVVGAGFTGVELATEVASDARADGDPLRVVLVDTAGEVGPELGPGPRPAILDALDRLGVELRLGRRVECVGAREVRLDDGTVLGTRTVVWTAGVTASGLVRDLGGPLDDGGRLRAAPDLRAARTPDVFVAGDTVSVDAAPGRPVLPSCQHAIQLGKFAGHNAAADVLGGPTAEFVPRPYVTCLDLGAAGAVYTTGWERTVEAVGPEAKEIKRDINRNQIYPPVDDPDAVLAAADPFD